MSVILECKNLTKVFGPKTALYGLNLSLESGRIIGLLGPNGSGKTTFIKLINGLVSPTEGEVLIDGMKPGADTKKIISYLPERSYLNSHTRVAQAVELFSDFYEDFDRGRAYDMLARLHIERNEKLGTMSKGTREKVHLILVMSRRARLYCLDEPIAGVDPAARDFILSTIINNYDENATILLSTHLISDIENILDEVIFLEYGQLRMRASVDDIRFNQGKSVDTLFREVFKC